MGHKGPFLEGVVEQTSSFYLTMGQWLVQCPFDKLLTTKSGKYDYVLSDLYSDMVLVF